MIELIFVTCLKFEPPECRERELIFYNVTLMTCLMGAQPVLAKWVNENPDWQIDKWECRKVLSAERDA